MLALIRRFAALVLAFLVSVGCPRPPIAWRDPSPHNVHVVEVDRDVRLEVLDWGGSGRPVLLLTGSGLSAHIYDDFAPKLTAFSRVYGITRRGYGASSQPASGYDNQRLADDICRVIESLKIEAPVLVGHSMAGGEITTLGNQHSDRLAGLVYLDSLGDPRDWPASDPAYMELSGKLPSNNAAPLSADESKSFAGYRAWQMRTMRFAFPESELRSIFATNTDGSMGPYKSSPAISTAIGKGEIRRDYSKIRVPALAFLDYPRQDRFVTKPGEYQPKDDEERAAIDAFSDATAVYVDRWIANFKEALPDARIVDLSGAGHYMFFTREADVIYELQQFVAKLKPEASLDP